MATIWAAYAGTWTTDPSSGWSHTLKISSLLDLGDQIIKQSPMRGAVTKLAIVAHGDKEGVVELDFLLTTQSVPSCGYAISRLGDVLTKDGRLIFFSCIAGAGEAGSALLNALSTRLPGRSVIGFEVSGLMGATGLPNTPGKMPADQSTPGFKSNPLVADTSGSMNLNEDSWFSKWSKDGNIIRIPLSEQSKPGRKNRCASPTCQGHAKPFERCQ